MIQSPRFSMDVPGNPSIDVPYENIIESTSKTWKEKFWYHATSTIGIIIGAFIGICFGIILSTCHIDQSIIKWIELPGTLFLRALKCVIIPLVFCNLSTGMADMLEIGKASSIGIRTTLLYMLTTLIAAIEGILWVIIFRSYYNPSNSIKINESIILNTNETSNELIKLTLSESIQEMFKEMVPENIMDSFSRGSLLSIIMFSIPFGIIMATTYPPSTSSIPYPSNMVLNFFKQLNEIFMKFIRIIVLFTPIGVLFLIAGAISSRNDLIELLQTVGILMGTIWFALAIHMYIFYPILLYIFIRKNPFPYLKQLIPAQIFAIGAHSSMATLPVTMKCVKETGEVSSTLMKFILPLGATINMDGSAIYFPQYIIFIAETALLGHHITISTYILLALACTLGSMGTAPVPQAGLVMSVTIWSTVFPHLTLPATFSYIFASNWIIAPFAVAVNVTGDAVIARIVAEMVNETTPLEDIRLTFHSHTSSNSVVIQKLP